MVFNLKKKSLGHKDKEWRRTDMLEQEGEESMAEETE